MSGQGWCMESCCSAHSDSPHVYTALRDKLTKGSTNLYPENDKTLLKVNNT